jgi:hypothetical protein
MSVTAETKEHDHKITVNGRIVDFTKAEISYEEVVKIAFPEANFAKETYTVTYFSEKDKKEGSLVKGQKVAVSKGMIFTVVFSGAS